MPTKEKRVLTYNDFQCIKCGLCCQSYDLVEPEENFHLKHGVLSRGDL